MACNCIVKSILLVLLTFIGVSFFLGPGFRMQPTTFNTLGSPGFYGPYSVNKCLDTAEHLVTGIPNPESLATKDGILYASLSDGRIIKINKNKKTETVVRVDGDNCNVMKRNSPQDESQCGRPLGMRFDSSGNLVVADILKGLYQISLSTGKVTNLVQRTSIVDGQPVNFPNDLTISSKGDIYFTEVTTRWLISEWGMFAAHIAFMENAPNGRVIHYDPKTKKARTLVDGIFMANGIQLSAKEDFLIISQVGKYNLLKYHLQGVKKGQLEVLVNNLPGLPDNIRPSGRGTLWLSLFAVRKEGRPNFLETTMHWENTRFPFARRIIFSALIFTIRIMETITEYIPFPFLDTITQQMHYDIWNIFGDRTYGLVIEMKEDGTILRSLHSPSGKLNQISEVAELDNVLYFASPFNDFIGKFNLHK